MPITVPVTKTKIGVAAFGKPVVDAINALSVLTSFTPTPRTASGAPALGNSDISGCKYVRVGAVTLVSYMITFGSTWNGGVGVMTFDLPAGVSPSVPATGIAKLWIPGSAQNYLGTLYSNPGETRMHPLFPASASNVAAADLRSTLDGNTGNGIPAVPGQYTLQPNGNLQAFLAIY